MITLVIKDRVTNKVLEGEYNKHSEAEHACWMLQKEARANGIKADYIVMQKKN